MLYNLGQIKILSDVMIKAGFWAALICSTLAVCVAFSVAVRIGNWILGW